MDTNNTVRTSKSTATLNRLAHVGPSGMSFAMTAPMFATKCCWKGVKLVRFHYELRKFRRALNNLTW